MRISSVIQIAKQYLVVGSIASILFLIGYFVIYRRLLKGCRKLDLKQIILTTILIIYVGIVLGATLGIRSSGFEGINFHLFSSYIEAWNSFSLREWRLLILNILMFVPLGFILPLFLKKCEKWYITYLIGFASTLFIEVTQLISKRGIFEFDDILNNTLGCMIGYGIVMIFIIAFKKKNQKNKAMLTIAYQIPIIITVIIFSVVFISYSKQELGNLSITNSYKVDMSDIDVQTKLNLQDKPQKAFVYKATVGTKSEALKLANKILSNVNKEVDESKNDEYDETIVYKTEDDKYHLWVNYVGLTTWYTDFTEIEAKPKKGLSIEDVNSKLSKFGINIPKEASLEEIDDGRYIIAVDMKKSGDVYLDGELSCEISENGIVRGFNNDIIEYKPYKEYDILSEEEAYNKFLNGEFKLYEPLAKNTKIEVTDINLKYEVDSKGFYQPVYEINTNINKESKVISIPALR